MSMAPGTYKLDPGSATLSVRTGRRGAIAKVGHDLLLEVQAWGATVEVGADGMPAVLELTADARSLKVREGTGGVKPLGDDDRANIAQTIDEDVLKGTSIAFRSRSVTADGSGRLTVAGDLELSGGNNPITFELTLDDDGHVAGSAVVIQSAWGMKPYTTLFGTLKVADEVEVVVDGGLSAV
jgi:polyisoprenoid-binding protein YceI